MSTSADKLDWNWKALGFSAALFIALRRVSGIAIDNGVESTDVKCNPDSIEINFRTQKPFVGRIFVKEMSDKSDCVRSFVDDTSGGVLVSTSFAFGDCNMQRTRMLVPQRGMMQSVIVIISFHRLFLTKIDRAYRVQCFYMEADKMVTSGFTVSMLPTTDLIDTASMPVCTYTVRSGTRNGQITQFASIGDKVFHEWECASRTHGMLVKNCFVDDGGANRQQLLDTRGCSIDRILMGELTYESTGTSETAYVETHVFKYADKPRVHFKCVIQLCNKADDTCDAITPPRCPSRIGRRLRRSVLVEVVTYASSSSNSTYELDSATASEMDLTADSFIVLDIDENTSKMEVEAALAGPPAEVRRDTATRRLLNRLEKRPGRPADASRVCVSSNAFGLLMSLVVAVFALSMATVAASCFRRVRSSKATLFR